MQLLALYMAVFFACYLWSITNTEEWLFSGEYLGVDMYLGRESVKLALGYLDYLRHPFLQFLIWRMFDV